MTKLVLETFKKYWNDYYYFDRNYELMNFSKSTLNWSVQTFDRKINRIYRNKFIYTIYRPIVSQMLSKFREDRSGAAPLLPPLLLSLKRPLNEAQKRIQSETHGEACRRSNQKEDPLWIIKRVIKHALLSANRPSRPRVSHLRHGTRE